MKIKNKLEIDIWEEFQDLLLKLSSKVNTSLRISPGESISDALYKALTDIAEKAYSEGLKRTESDHPINEEDHD